ncbi:MAG TPA: DUF1801 domain-containing protein [Anaerolineales bacterium]|nr:DUF1801 domain-containing protein [Anaerolineales bacterium]HLE04375.1 DUF1801 domain-containing protein [Anaerolineales bacterium]
MKEVFPDAIESRDEADMGFGFGKGYKDMAFVISPQKSHVNLGIARGAELPDSFGLLRGSGKVHRHVRITSLEDLANPDLRRLMESALKAVRTRRELGA